MKMDSISYNLLFKLSDEGLNTFKFVQGYLEWEKKYNFKHETSDGNNYWWIENLKGVKFDTQTEAKEYAFINWCNNHLIVVPKYYDV